VYNGFEVKYLNDKERINRMRVVVDGRLRHMVSAGVTPGVSYAVVAGDATYQETFGNETVLPVTTPLRSGLTYDLASLTKVVGTTPLFLQATAAGKLALEQEVRTVLPEFSGADLTFRELMTHTSGLEGYIPHRDELPADALQQALTTQLHVGASRGTVVYRDFNLLLTGWALEKVYGDVPIQHLITERVLRPWRLDATFSPNSAETVPTTYSKVAGLRRGLVHDPKAAILGVHSGAAGLFATIPAMIHYMRVAFGDVTQTQLSSAWAQNLQQDFSNGAGRSIGFDLRYVPGQSRPWLYHTGYTGTFILVDPTARLGLVVLANRVHPVVHPGFLTLRDALIEQWLNDISSWR
jgi:CubicO group peptidase (beta-lactamase class C family)